MTDGILALGKFDFAGVAAEETILFDSLGKFREDGFPFPIVSAEPESHTAVSGYRHFRGLSFRHPFRRGSCLGRCHGPLPLR